MAYQVLHYFNNSDGANSYADLLLVGTTLYGTTQYGGGGGNNGTIFSFNISDNSLTILHSFQGDPNDGATPQAGLILGTDGRTLYGTTRYGGTYNRGTVFSINILNNSVIILYSVQEEVNDGFDLVSRLLLVGTTLYGTTVLGGGPDNNGTIFSLDILDNSLTILHSFQGEPNDGAEPQAGLILGTDGRTLYGTTSLGGGSDNNGTIFSLDISDNSFNILHSFEGSPNDGATPQAELILGTDGRTLYGTSQSGGGDAGVGTVFSLDISDNLLTILHSFNNNDGRFPSGGLLLVGTILYGTATNGGVNSVGTVFSLDISDNSVNVLCDFNVSDGNSPVTGLITDGITLYGTTQYGGTGRTSGNPNTGYGVIFSIDIPQPPQPPPPPPPKPCVCPKPAIPKQGISFGGNLNIPGHEETQAFRTSYQLINSLYTNGSKIEFYNAQENRCKKPPPRNTFG